jgi:hypothetical protein
MVGTVNAPVIGARYWFGPRVGLDAGIGFGLQSGNEQPKSVGVALHAGIPVALVHTGHYTLEIVPETTVGFTAGTIQDAAQGAQSVNGFLLRVGARAGAEVHFGFIGIPELALQATIGVYYAHESVFVNQSGVTFTGTSDLLTTSVDAAPWAIFTNTVTALYYF